jgi:hypothetical protein
LIGLVFLSGSASVAEESAEASVSRTVADAWRFSFRLGLKVELHRRAVIGASGLDGV